MKDNKWICFDDEKPKYTDILGGGKTTNDILVKANGKITVARHCININVYGGEYESWSQNHVGGYDYRCEIEEYKDHEIEWKELDD